MKTLADPAKYESLSTAELWELRGAVNKALIVKRSANQERSRVASMIAFAASQGDFKSSLGRRPPANVALARTYTLIQQCESAMPGMPIEQVVRVVLEAL
jgi:hypothetical protein